MELSEMHVGQTVFSRGNRNYAVKVTAIGNNAALVQQVDGGMAEQATLAEYFESIPNDLHDKDGKPLKMGDAFTTRTDGEHTVCGAFIGKCDVLFIVDDDDAAKNRWNLRGWLESDITKVEQVETVDDVRLYVNSYDWTHSSAERVQFIIDRTEKAVRAEYER